MIGLLTDEAVHSLVGNNKVVTVPCVFNKMIGLNHINFYKCIFDRAGGLYKMIAVSIHNILLKTDTIDAQTFSVQSARFAVFMGLLHEF